MKITFLPVTKLGMWSIGLASGVFVFFFIRLFIMRLGHGAENDTFFSNPYQAIPAVLAVLSGAGAFFMGIISFFKNKELSVLVGLAVLLGLFVLSFGLGEVVSPH